MAAFLKKLFFNNISEDKSTPKVVMTLGNAQVNENEMVFAIGDIHGRLDLLEKQIQKIRRKVIEFKDKYVFHLVFLGDYIDRGHQSRQVIERLMSLKIDNCTIHYLMGNHEDILLKFLSNPHKYYKVWMAIGGIATLSNFGISGLDDVQLVRQQLLKQMGMKMIGFLNNLNISYTNGDYFFCHAVPSNDKPLNLQSKKTLLNNRKANISKYEKIVVHGHVSRDKVEFLESRINIDTGAYATENLTCLLVKNHNQIVL
ncbi:MAG: metallophosphoesterase [Alphaproteobacteria bacterium]|nr:metallophosphoesterase [Alphaproteobacteria bacterium]